MTREAKKEYLKSYRRKREEIQRIEQEINSLKDETGEAERRESLSELLEQKRSQCARICMDIIESIEKMEGDTESNLVLQRNLLVERYIRGKKWEEIEESMHYQKTQLHRIHEKALEHFRTQN